MDIKPIPVPAQGTTLGWNLDQPYRAKHLLWLLLVLAVLLFTGHRTEMDKMVVLTGQAVGNLVGLNDESQVVRGLSRVGRIHVAACACYRRRSGAPYRFRP